MLNHIVIKWQSWPVTRAAPHPSRHALSTLRLAVDGIQGRQRRGATDWIDVGGPGARNR